MESCLTAFLPLFPSCLSNFHHLLTLHLPSILHGRSGPTRQDHLLHAAHSHLLHRLAHSNGHVVQQRLVSLEAGIRVALNVRGPLVFSGVGVPRAHVSVHVSAGHVKVVGGANVLSILLHNCSLCLELLELLLRAEFVGHVYFMIVSSGE